jgi:hypothetical protein
LFELTEDIPKAGPKRLSDGRLMMPYTAGGAAGPLSFEETFARQEAPKLTMAAGSGPFAFGGLIRLDACSIVPWAGGDAIGKTMVGRPRNPRLSHFIVPWTGSDLIIRQSQPPNGEYRFLFSLVGGASTDVQPGMVAGLDTLRGAWETYFPLIMSSRRANTSSFS